VAAGRDDPDAGLVDLADDPAQDRTPEFGQFAWFCGVDGQCGNSASHRVPGAHAPRPDKSYPQRPCSAPVYSGDSSGLLFGHRPQKAVGMSTTDTTTNTVTLHGRVSADPTTRTLPSGDDMATFRLIVDRPGALRRKTGQPVDTFDCVAWTAALRKK